jgi:hypothetical protein
MHFNKEPGPGTALCTNIQAGIRFKKDGDVIRHVTRGEDLRIRGFSIPPGESSYSASTEYTFEEDVELLGFMPHMHLRGKAALYEVTYPDGKHETLLHVPKYDFNWQHSYDFIEPKLDSGGLGAPLHALVGQLRGQPGQPGSDGDRHLGAPHARRDVAGLHELPAAEGGPSTWWATRSRRTSRRLRTTRRTSRDADIGRRDNEAGSDLWAPGLSRLRRRRLAAAWSRSTGAGPRPWRPSPRRGSLRARPAGRHPARGTTDCSPPTMPRPR